MKLTKRQKIMASVFALALGGLTADRLFLGPDSTQAVVVAEGSAAGLDPEAADGKTPVVAARPIAERIETLWNDKAAVVGPTRDVFAISSPWLMELRAEGDGPTAMEAPERFAATHQLSAIVIEPQRSYILIDDKLLVPGQELDGFMLAAINEDSCRFESADGQVVLTLVDDR
jgi:hypothetical protein